METTNTASRKFVVFIVMGLVIGTVSLAAAFSGAGGASSGMAPQKPAVQSGQTKSSGTGSTSTTSSSITNSNTVNSSGSSNKPTTRINASGTAGGKVSGSAPTGSGGKTTQTNWTGGNTSGANTGTGGKMNLKPGGSSPALTKGTVDNIINNAVGQYTSGSPSNKAKPGTSTTSVKSQTGGPSGSGPSDNTTSANQASDGKKTAGKQAGGTPARSGGGGGGTTGESGSVAANWTSADLPPSANGPGTIVRQGPEGAYVRYPGGEQSFIPASQMGPGSGGSGTGSGGPGGSGTGSGGPGGSGTGSGGPGGSGTGSGGPGGSGTGSGGPGGSGTGSGGPLKGGVTGATTVTKEFRIFCSNETPQSLANKVKQSAQGSGLTPAQLAQFVNDVLSRFEFSKDKSSTFDWEITDGGRGDWSKQASKMVIAQDAGDPVAEQTLRDILYDEKGSLDSTVSDVKIGQTIEVGPSSVHLH